MKQWFIISLQILAFFILFSFVKVSIASPAQKIEGVLSIVWADPHPESKSKGGVHYTVTTATGEDISLQVPKHQANKVNQFFGKTVVVSGDFSESQSSTTGQMMLLDSIKISPQAEKNQLEASEKTGTRKLIYLLLKFPDDAQVPHPPQFYLDLTNPDTPPAGASFPATINGYFKKTSWNQISWLADVGGTGGIGAPGGWITLPHPKSYYAPCGWGEFCLDWNAIASDGLAVGRSQGINFTEYDNVNLVFSNDLDCCAYGGSYYSAVDKKQYATTWEPPWGQETGVYAHELGHSLGLPHSGWVYHAYDSPWDIMSKIPNINHMLCGSYLSKNSAKIRNLWCGEPGNSINIAYKDHLGWVPPERTLVLKNGPFDIYVDLGASTFPIDSKIKMIKACLNDFPCEGESARYLTIASRIKGTTSTSQYDNGIPDSGVVIHYFQKDRPRVGGKCFFNNSSGWAKPLDMTYGDYDSTACEGLGLTNAQLLPGQTYQDLASGVTIKVESQTDSSFIVRVTKP